jgi:hypothetical protein
MTDPTTPAGPAAPPETNAPVEYAAPVVPPAPVGPKKVSIGKRIAIIAVTIVAAAGAWIGTQAILTAVNAPRISLPAPAPADPVTYTSSAYGFSVELPSEPEEATTTQMLGGGLSAELTTATLTSDNGNYIVSAAKFPKEIAFDEAEFDTTLDNSVTGMVGAITGATLKSSETIDLDGENARAGVIEVTGQPDQLFVVAFRDNVQFVLISSGVSNAGHESFVDSFAFGD